MQISERLQMLNSITHQHQYKVDLLTNLQLSSVRVTAQAVKLLTLTIPTRRNAILTCIFIRKAASEQTSV